MTTSSAPEPDAGARAPATRFADVALKLPLQRAFTYAIAAGMPVAVGSRVRVPFRGKTMSGVVVSLRDDSGDVDPSKLRSIEKVLDDGTMALPPTLMQLAQRMVEDYGCSLGEALDATVPAAAKQRSARRIPHVELAIPHDIAVEAVGDLEEDHQPRARVLRAVLEFGAAMPIQEVKRRTGTSDSPWKTLVKHGTLRRTFLDEVAEPLERRSTRRRSATNSTMRSKSRSTRSLARSTVERPRRICCTE